MKKALVVGASGGIGYALVRELVARNIEVIAFSRHLSKLHSLYGEFEKVTAQAGDALIKQDLVQAVTGVESIDVIFHAVSFPYTEWEEKHLQCIEIMLEVAKTSKSKIALVDNIYAYGQQPPGPVTEDAIKKPHTKKGALRLMMENKLIESDVPALIVHMPDLYGPNAENTILHETLRYVVKNKKANYVGNPHIAREFLYTYDGAKAMVELALRNDTYNQNWNIPSAHPITGTELLSIIKEVSDYTNGIRTISRRTIQLMGLFSPQMKEMAEMMYLTEHPLILSGEKYEKEIGPLPRTPYREGIRETIAWMNERI